jgi:hypothetical protein
MGVPPAYQHRLFERIIDPFRIHRAVPLVSTVLEYAYPGVDILECNHSPVAREGYSRCQEMRKRRKPWKKRAKEERENWSFKGSQGLLFACCVREKIIVGGGVENMVFKTAITIPDAKTTIK